MNATGINTTSMNTTSGAFFEEKYRSNSDPWNFRGSEYERARYDKIVRSIAHRVYRRAFEPGCSIGVLTEQLAGYCELLEALDISPTAVANARQRCASLSNVDIAVGKLPVDLPTGRFDLIVFSELGYYFPEEELRALGASLLASLEPGGVFLAVHWLGFSCDHLLSGDRVHDILYELPGLSLELSEINEGFRLDRWVKA